MAYPQEVPSAAQISGHPIHPMLIPFPIAYLVGALATDLAYLATEDMFWATASLWLLRAGLAMGVLAAVFGMIDFFSRPRIREHRVAWYHFLGNATVLVLAWANLWLRDEAIAGGLNPTGVALSVITVAILLYTGWAGGELAYRYRIGAIPPSSTIKTTRRTPAGDERRAGPRDRRGELAM